VPWMVPRMESWLAPWLASLA
jgi:hypothetical protein